MHKHTLSSLPKHLQHQASVTAVGFMLQLEYRMSMEQCQSAQGYEIVRPIARAKQPSMDLRLLMLLYAATMNRYRRQIYAVLQSSEGCTEVQ